MIRHGMTLAALTLFACNGCNDGRPPPAPAAAASTASGGTAPTPAAAETIIHAEDDGKPFDVARGAAVTFKLASNAGTGYVWVPTQVDATVLSQQGDRTNELGSDTPGAPKMDVYRFVGAAPGSTTVEMSLKRPFGSAPPARVIHVTVNVH
jgi:predicted secreted protein